ncbi:MAG: alpha/beta fold hydrolase [Acidimicrobiales bacterium]
MEAVRPVSARRTRLVSASAAVLGTVLLLTSCSGPSIASSTTSPAAAQPTETTTTVVPEVVAGTTESGALAYMGSVSRIPVMAVPDGLTGTTVPLPGTAGYRAEVPIAYRQTGSGRELLLISGEDASMTWWSPALIQELSQHYQVTMFDLPGVGYSGAPSSAVSVSWLADVTAGLINELGLTQPVVLGWGFGGQIALALAERHPPLVSDLVLADTALAVPGSQPMTLTAAKLFTSPASTPAAISAVMFPAGAPRAGQAWLQELSAQVPDSVTSSAIAAESRAEAELWRSGALVGGLAALKLPVLVIAGSADNVFPSGDATLLSAAIAGAQHYLWRGTGYGGLLQEPVQFTTLVEDFTG